MVERRAEIKRRSYRVHKAVIDHLGGKPDRQYRAFQEAMRDIETTGDSMELGALLATIDDLATRPLKEMTPSHREEIREVAGELWERLGWKQDAVPEVYRVWKEAEDVRRTRQRSMGHLSTNETIW